MEVPSCSEEGEPIHPNSAAFLAWHNAVHTGFCVYVVLARTERGVQFDLNTSIELAAG